MKTAPNNGLTRRQIIQELKERGWQRNRQGWASPRHKRLFQRCSLREAASLECLTSREDLSAKPKRCA